MFGKDLFSWFKSRPRKDRCKLTLRDIMEKLNTMSAQILAVTTAVNAAFDKITAALDGIKKDIAELKKGGAVTPEARAALADLETRANSVRDAITALDDEMPEVSTPPVEPPAV